MNCKKYPQQKCTNSLSLSLPFSEVEEEAQKHSRRVAIASESQMHIRYSERDREKTRFPCKRVRPPPLPPPSPVTFYVFDTLAREFALWRFRRFPETCCSRNCDTSNRARAQFDHRIAFGEARREATPRADKDERQSEISRRDPDETRFRVGLDGEGGGGD